MRVVEAGTERCSDQQFEDALRDCLTLKELAVHSAERLLENALPFYRELWGQDFDPVEAKNIRPLAPQGTARYRVAIRIAARVAAIRMTLEELQ